MAIIFLELHIFIYQELLKNLLKWSEAQWLTKWWWVSFRYPNKTTYNILLKVHVPRVVSPPSKYVSENSYDPQWFDWLIFLSSFSHKPQDTGKHGSVPPKSNTLYENIYVRVNL